VITETEINAAQKVVDAWVSVVSKLRSRKASQQLRATES